MRFTLRLAASYLNGEVPVPSAYKKFVGQIGSVISFPKERANRLVRYVRIVQAYENNTPVRDIEQAHGCSRQTILRYARLAGLSKRPKGFGPKVRERCIKLYKAKVPIATIKKRLNVSLAYISKAATEEGINRRDFSKHHARNGKGR